MAKRWIAAMACALVLAVGLVGCGGGGEAGGSAEPDYAADFVGTWQLVSMDDEGEATSQEDIEMLAALGLYAYVNLGQDGQATFSLFGEDMTGTWEATGAGAGSITLEGQSVNMSLADGTLTFAQDETELHFQQDAYSMDADTADLEALFSSGDDADADAAAEDEAA